MSNLRRNASDTAKISGGVLAASALALVLVILVASMWIFGFGLFQRSTADFRGETAAIEQIQADANFRISSYEQFFDLCNDIVAQESQIGILEDELAGNPTPSREAQLNQAITAQKLQRAENIANYNSAAAQTETRGLFLDSSLPDELSVEQTTICG